MVVAEYTQKETERYESIFITNIKAFRLCFNRYRTIWSGTNREEDIHLYIRLSFQDNEEKKLMIEIYDGESIKNLGQGNRKKEYIVLCEKSRREILPAIELLLPEIRGREGLPRTFILNLEERVIN